MCGVDAEDGASSTYWDGAHMHFVAKVCEIAHQLLVLYDGFLEAWLVICVTGEFYLSDGYGGCLPILLGGGVEEGSNRQHDITTFICCGFFNLF